ncbi:MAG: thermonuclease family protein [Alphaproteobacteria bacterium]
MPDFNILKSRFNLKVSVFLCLLLALAAFPLRAQETTASEPAVFTTLARATDAATLLSNDTVIRLWGAEAVAGAPVFFQLKARTALDNALAGRKVECEIKARNDRELEAQCVNAGDIDLSLFMIQEGYATVERTAIYGTVFENAYIQAETQAQNKGIGVWGLDSKSDTSSGDGSVLLIFGFILFLCIIGAFTFLSIVIMRGFQKIIDAQTDNVDMMNKERKLRDKERRIVAIMLDSEIKSSRSKIEAYLVVYEETLRGLKDTAKPPKYKRAGDILQKQPALDRAVFDRNTDKIDILGDRLSSELIHFYARIKTSPEYANIVPETPLDEVIEMVEKALDSARRLHELSETLIQGFEDSGVLSQKS